MPCTTFLHSTMSTPTRPSTLAPAFAAAAAVPRTAKAERSRCALCGANRPPTAPPSMVMDAETVGTGYALLNHLKGVVIGPTINEITAAIAGGTVGVMGTIIALEVRRQRVKERKQCPYCRGSGRLPCGSCYSIGTMPSTDAASGHKSCPMCSNSGQLVCNHCEGDGRLIPFVYERAVRMQYEDYVYSPVDDYYADEPPYP